MEGSVGGIALANFLETYSDSSEFVDEVHLFACQYGGQTTSIPFMADLHQTNEQIRVDGQAAYMLLQGMDERGISMSQAMSQHHFSPLGSDVA